MFDLGDVVPLSVQVKDSSGALADAGAMALTVTKPDGTSTNPTISHDGLGLYSATYTTTVVGRHQVRWVATGANAAAFTDVFDVRPAASTALFSLADARAVLNLSTTTNDEELRDYIDATTVAVERRVGAVIPRTVVETLRARRDLVLSVTPVVSITSIVGPLMAAVPVDVANVWFDPNTGQVRLTNRAWFADDIYTVTYTAGRADVVPPNVSVAARIILKHLWRTQQLSSSRQIQDTGMPPGYGFAVPQQAEQLLEPSLNMDGIA